MADPYLGEIRIFAGNFAPKGWALCDGQLMAISQNTALFSLLGTMYGGDGKSTFALPGLQGRVPIDQGQGPGMSQRVVGENGGSSTVTLLVTGMPSHPHVAGCQTNPGGLPAPTNNVWSGLPGRPTPPPVYTTAGPNTNMSPQALGQTGGSLPHNNMSPYLGLTFIIALQGVFPTRN
jgi:microcystin-dependent protein